MIKLKNGKRGFTLLEMVIVIAIIVIISIVIYFSVSDYLTASRSATEKLNDHISIIENAAAEASACM